MNGLKPDNTGLAAIHEQPEFSEQLWQYLNRRVSDWRIIAGRQSARICRAVGTHRARLWRRALGTLGVWGVESTFGELLVQKKHMRPVIPSLATLAWGEPAAHILGSGIAQCATSSEWLEQPAEMNGSWAGAMGHTQWMPEVWLHVGVDYDHDGKISPFGGPTTRSPGRPAIWSSAAGTAAASPGAMRSGCRKVGAKKARSYAAWRDLGIVRADGQDFPSPMTRRSSACR